MKLILFFIIISLQASAQSSMPLSSGELITKNKILASFDVLKNKMISGKYFLDFSYNLPSKQIKKQEILAITSLFQEKLNSPLGISLGNAVNAGELILVFSKINQAIDGYRYLSCKDLLNKQPHLRNQNREYNIQPQSVANISAFCDMTSEGGGWTRLSSQLASSNKSFSANGYALSAQNIGGDCPLYSPSVRMNNIKISDWTIARDDFSRSNTMVQCPQIDYQNGGVANRLSYYESGGNYYPVSVCAWAYQNGPTAWDNNSAISMVGGEASNIRIIADFLQNRSQIEFTSRCSTASDNGWVSHVFFVK